jgi:hypothetical protein
MTEYSAGWTIEDQRESNRKHYHSHPEKMRATYLRRREGIKAWKQAHPQEVKAQNQKWKDKNPEKVKAKYTIQTQVRNGAIERPTKCTECGTTMGVEFHHPDYSKPLEVLAVCRQCHANLRNRRAK